MHWFTTTALSLAMHPLFLSGQQTPHYFTVRDTEIYIAGPGEFSTEPFSLSSGFLWIRTHDSAFSFQLRNYPQVTIEPQSFVGCRVLMEEHSCFVLHGHFAMGPTSVEEGMSLDLKSKKQESILILPEGSQEADGWRIIWSIAPGTPKRFFVSAGMRPDHSQIYMQKMTNEQSVLIPVDMPKPLFASVMAFQPGTKKRVTSPMLPLALFTPLPTVTPPPAFVPTAQASTLVTVGCQVRPLAFIPTATVYTVDGTKETLASEQLVKSCPFMLGPLKPAAYHLVMTWEEVKLSMNFEIKKVDAASPVPSLIKNEITWAPDDANFYYEVEIRHQKERLKLTSWAQPVRLPANYTGDVSVRLRPRIALTGEPLSWTKETTLHPQP
jgi:hypothetical protein